MAYETQGERISQTAGEDLTSAQRLLCKQGGVSDNTVVKATDATAPIRGVITEGHASGRVSTVQISGVAKVIAGAAVSAGAIVTADAQGRAVTVSAAVGNRYVLGEALEAAAGAGVVISVLIAQGTVNTAVS